MAPNVATIDMGNARLGMIVAERFRRNKKITSTTRQIARTSVNWTSSTDWRIETERSYSVLNLTDAGSCVCKEPSSCLTSSTTSSIPMPRSAGE
jgi:hypothetical protein